MAFNKPVLCHAFANASTGALTPYTVVRLTTANTIAVGSTGTGKRVIGVVQDDPSGTAQYGAVAMLGISRVRCTSGAITVGQGLVATTGGLAQASTSAQTSAANQYVFGFALEAIAASTARGTNDRISAFIGHVGQG